MNVDLKSCDSAIAALICAARMAVEQYACCIANATTTKKIYDDAINQCSVYLFKARTQLADVEKMCAFDDVLQKKYETLIRLLKEKIELIEERLRCLWHERAAAIFSLEDLLGEAQFLKSSVQFLADNSTTAIDAVKNNVISY